ncbi:hypothetical protein AWN76_016155 [Rhodothermaceae bacterium RA]|nr:hypothetical protein AWN76_016155 [Rhodothermaceae bacterium RA]
MDVQPTSSPPSGPIDERRARAEQTFWEMAAVLYRRRRFILGTTMAVAVLSVVLSLMMPVWYRASTRLLLPEGSGSGGLSAMLGDLGPAAAALLGGGGGDTDRYFSILSSRRVLDRVVSTFDLETVYETTDSETPRADAIRLLQDNVEFVIDQEYGFIAVEVYDQDPERAAAMANFFVEELNRVNSELLSQNAANYRRFMEQSLRETEAALDSALAALQRFQERHGVIDLPTQTQAFLQNIAALRTDVLQAEIQAEVLRRQYGPDNPRVRAMQDAAAAAQTRYEAAFQGSERMLPVPQTAVPELARQYAKLQQEVLIQGEILKFVRPLYEQARFDEQREKMAVQVLDPAVPPERKAKPKRSIIVIMATLSAGMLAVLFVLLTDWWRRNYRTLLERLTTMASSQP